MRIIPRFHVTWVKRLYRDTDLTRAVCWRHKNKTSPTRPLSSLNYSRNLRRFDWQKCYNLMRNYHQGSLVGKKGIVRRSSMVRTFFTLNSIYCFHISLFYAVDCFRRGTGVVMTLHFWQRVCCLNLMHSLRWRWYIALVSCSRVKSLHFIEAMKDALY